MLLDTIAAISTPRGEGGISIVRMSGQDSLNILEKIFRPKNKKASELKNYSINYGHIIDNEHIVDEVLVSIMKAPNTYTREDIVEINCHGGFLVTEKVLEVVLKNGARIAEIGEFTKRAFKWKNRFNTSRSCNGCNTWKDREISVFIFKSA